MKKWVIYTLASAMLLGLPLVSQADPEGDRKAFQDYFKNRFPNTPFEDFINGVYAIDPESREQWEAIEEFPPYEIAIEEGEQLFNKKFANGKSVGSCFPNGGNGIADQYPFFDTKRGEVVTLAVAVNECLTANGEKPMKYKKGPLASVLAYMAFTTRGKKVDEKIPKDPRALEAYESGKQFFYARRGQLNMSCAHCHVDNSGNKIRADLLSPALGHVTHFPVYRSKWGELGTLHRRFGGCNEQVRAKAFEAQGPEYRNLEYFMTYMSNGLTWNGPGSRK